MPMPYLVSELSFTLTLALSPVSSTGQALRERGSFELDWYSFCLAQSLYPALGCTVIIGRRELG